MARPHSERSDAGDSEQTPSEGDASAQDLRRQVAILAEQVRRLGDSAAAGSEAGDTEILPAPPPPRPRRTTVVQPAVATPARAVDPPAPAVAGAFASPAPADAATAQAPSNAAGDTLSDRSSRLIASVISLAELAAAEIRTSAELEAAMIRARSAEQAGTATTDHLLTLLERQRRMVAGLAEQTERLDQASAVLRAQIRALEAERQHIHEVLAASRRVS